MRKPAVPVACLILWSGLWACDQILGTDFDGKRLRSEPPQAGNTELVVVKGTKNNTGVLPASDLENDSLTYSLVSNGARTLALESTLGKLTLTDPDSGAFKYEANDWHPQNYQDVFEYQVNDGRQDAASPGRLTIRVLPRGPIKRVPSDDRDGGISQHPAGFGRSVDIQGDTAVVGAVNDSVVVLERQPSGDWTFKARIVKRPDSMNFGAEVALEGDWLLVGDPGQELPGKPATQGQAHFYKRLETGNFAYTYLVRSAAVNDGFGKEVALSKPASCASGNDCVNAAIGANGDDEKAGDVGAVFMYAVSSDKLELQSKLIPADGQAYDFFGTEVALDGDTLATVAASWREGQHGTAYLFERQAGGDWVDSGARFVPPGDWHGTIGHIGLTQQGLLCGASLPRGGAGIAYLWEKDAQGNWGQPLPIAPPPGSPGEFGETVAIEGDILVVTASLESKGAFAYFYRRTPSGWDFATPERTEAANDAAPIFGFDAVVSEQSVAIVAPHEFDASNEEIEKPDYSGAVYFYNVPKWGTD